VSMRTVASIAPLNMEKPKLTKRTQTKGHAPSAAVWSMPLCRVLWFVLNKLLSQKNKLATVHAQGDNPGAYTHPANTVSPAACTHVTCAL
jgi:hypothetical protein